MNEISKNMAEAPNQGPGLKSHHSTSTCRVQVEQGWLEGEQLDFVTKDGTYHSFKGIPYAAPPVGKLRFMVPGPLSPWVGVKKALNHGPKCPQVDLFTKEMILSPTASEDCLYLNVYTPNLKPNRPLPVMFFIHGGGYKSGSGDVEQYGPDFLVKQNIVLVTINYRLDALGFLSFENEDAPGNAGLKDQTAALRWVQKNIANFGGDPNNVTIFGESAGGASVGYHIISPMSKGLFHRAILMSGVPFCDWSIPYMPRRRAFILGKQLGKYTTNDNELLQYFQSIPVEKLVNTSPAVLVSDSIISDLDKMYYFSPVIEPNNGVDNFMTDSLENCINKNNVNDVDIIIGYTDQEALIDYQNFMKWVNTFDLYPEMLVPREIQLKATPTKILELSDKIREHYFGEGPISKDTLKEMVKYLNESVYIYDIHRFLRSIPISNKKRYLYRFSCVSERNIYSRQAASLSPDLIGASHLEDLMYLFDPKHARLCVDLQSKSYCMIKQTCELFANFAKYGDPTPDKSDFGVKWSPYDLKDKNYLDIGEALKPGRNLDEDVFKFWQSIYDEVK